MMMMSNGGGGAGDGNDNGRRRKRNHQEEEEEEEETAFMKDYPGYRFEPNDEELIKYYLYPKIKNLPLPPNTIKYVNVYFYNPWDLAETYGSFHFFAPTIRKCPNGKVLNRTVNGGYWEASGFEGPIIDNVTKKEIGYKKVLLFKPRKGSKEILSENQIGWHMYEYTLKKDSDEKNKSTWTENGGSNIKQVDELVLCKIFYLKPQLKSKKDRAVDVAAPPSNATTTPSAAVAVAAVQENHHQMYHYPLNSAAATEEMMPQDHYVCQTDVASADHRCPLTSRVLGRAAPPAEMMPFNVNPSSSSAILPPVNHHCYGEMMNQQRLQSNILPSVNHHCYGEMMNQQQLQSAMLPSANYHNNAQMSEQQLQPAMLSSVNQHYNGEMNQQQWQSVMLPSANYHNDAQMNEQKLQPAMLSSVNQHYNGEMNQQQLQLTVLPSVNHHTYGQMNQQQLQSAIVPSVNHQHGGEMMNQQQWQSEVLPNYYDEINQQQLQPAVLPSVNHPTDGQMTQEQLQEKTGWEMLYAAWNNDADYFLKLETI